ncbi:MAG: chromate efflux transporter [Candidatus Eremiobacteraeota bacterium]|nr:chromate efflux transporter [Candidatus Eremiobacteraeota bacterium]
MKSRSSAGKSGVVREVFTTFLRLGSTSFGGPIAHLAYFRRTFVQERRWLDEAAFVRIVAFCQIIPGPTSSQVGMLIGFTRGGPLGAFLAWLGFTAPSALAMTAIAALLTGAERHDPPVWLGGLLDGLFAAAAAVVAQAVVGLAASMCTGGRTKVIAVAALFVTLALRPLPGFQWVPIVLGAIAGALLLRAGGLRADGLPIRVPRGVSVVAGALFLALVAVTALPKSATVVFLATLIRAGSLVFGGGHVVLPLLQSMIRDGLISARDFFAGYGAVQAMPGPLNTFATFLGYANTSPLHGAAGALVATGLIFLPSFALIFAIAPVWNRLAGAPRAAGAVRGANASVVGLLGAVLYDPVLISLGGAWLRIAIALAAFAAIALFRVAPWIVVVTAAILGALLNA